MSIAQKLARGGDFTCSCASTNSHALMGWTAARSKHNPFVHPSFLLPLLLPPSTPREAVLLFFCFFLFFFPSPHPPQLYKSLIKLSLRQRTAQGTRSRMAHGILGLLRPLQSRLNASKIRLVLLCGVTEQHHSPAKWSERGFSSTQDGPGESR